MVQCAPRANNHVLEICDGYLSRLNVVVYCLFQLDLNPGNVCENFKRWKRREEVYLAASGASEKDDKVPTVNIFNCAGPRVLEVYDNFVWADSRDKDKPSKVLKALERYCDPRQRSHRISQILEHSIPRTV